MITPKDAEFRAQISRLLKPPLSEMEWEHIDSQQWLQRLKIGQLTLDGIADKIGQLRAAFASYPPQPRQRDSAPPDARGRALAAVIAQYIAALPSVRAFRSQMLSGNLLTFDALPAWFARQSEQDGPVTFYATAALPPGCAAPPAGWRCDTFDGLVEIGPRRLVIPCEPYSVAVAYKGVLDTLRELANSIAGDHSILPSEAVLTILTGEAPYIAPIEIVPTFRPLLAASRVQITVDLFTAPAELARRFREWRRVFFRQRCRSLSEKHLALAEFMASRPENESSRESMREWNRHRRKWRYKHLSNFLRDAKQARRRLLFPQQLRVENVASYQSESAPILNTLGDSLPDRNKKRGKIRHK